MQTVLKIKLGLLAVMLAGMIGGIILGISGFLVVFPVGEPPIVSLAQKWEVSVGATTGWLFVGSFLCYLFGSTGLKAGAIADRQLEREDRREELRKKFREALMKK